jgi:hypothetical protein
MPGFQLLGNGYSNKKQFVADINIKNYYSEINLT